MFGRDLTEQADADKEAVPVIVRKCIAAVDAIGMEYEGASHSNIAELTMRADAASLFHRHLPEDGRLVRGQAHHPPVRAR